MSENLKLSNQVCFPIYSLAKEVVSLYRPILQRLDLTYPQYLVMLVLWEEGTQNVSEIGTKLNLDSGTLTPLLKRLAEKNLIERNRSTHDERIVQVKLTASGQAIKTTAAEVPEQILNSLNVSIEQLEALKAGIDNILNQIKK
ncbi:DNA-binding MarR family transcriptional regulator [Roseivirga pacifica]|uniref:HTH-type transcriptional regulator SarZ n=1 Tax=Roseivirga pacifica TaxID=1267423 RepID=A0A1I0R019_9BACT|nr:MarR family transcriptional regulator [Roseivirga pacifica]RKQ42235.1 DNA-binding MarR family transcriptional regulator [Roseivirga pacifica]SEW33610.1 DNA-binding transcriptional regulator, MarR family [Roseivirga pacifica]